MTEHEIVAKAEKKVKEWIDYAKQEYGWGDKVFELFEEPMIEVATSVAVQTTKDLQEENRSLLESCEGATMMYKDLCKAKEIINELVDDYIAIGYAAVDAKLIDKATDFLKENK